VEYCIKHLQWMSSYLFGLLYQVFIIPLFDYCDVVWCLSTTQLKILERLHSRAISSVVHVKQKLSSYFDYSILERIDVFILLFRFLTEILHQVSPSLIFAQFILLC